MKKLLIPLLIIVSLQSFGQTAYIGSPVGDITSSSTTKIVLSTKDTLKTTTITTTSITSKVVYDTAISKSVTYDTLKYIAPVIIPPISIMPGGLSSRPVSYSYKSNFTISGLSFDGAKGSVDLITLNNCSNVHITLCRFSNTNGISVKLTNCQNVTVDFCYFTMVNFGVFATGSTGMKVNFNQGLNLWAPVKYNGNFAHWVQFYNCPASAGQQVNYNSFQSIDFVAVHPHDAVSIDADSGTPTSPIQIWGNKIKGGQIAGGWPLQNNTGVGITAPDVSGSYYDIRNNIVVNSGVNGIIVVATGSNILIDGNIIVNDNKNAKVSYDGFTISGTKSNMTVSNNRVRWMQPDGTWFGYWFGGSSTFPGVTLINNNWNDANLTSNILPASIITYK